MNPLAFILTLIAALNLNNAQVNLDDGLVAYYPFNGNANDESGNGYDGTIYGATLTEDRFGNPNSAFYFYDDYISFPHVVMNGKGDISVSIWVKPDRTSTVLHPLSVAGPSTANEYLLIYSGNRLGLTIKASYYGFTNTGLNANEWKHILITRKGSDGMVGFYTDGDLKGLVALNSGTSSVSSGGLMIGQEQDCVGGCFDSEQDFEGTIDDLRFYDRILTADEIDFLYTFGSPTYSPTKLPTLYPSLSPTDKPTFDPSINPTSTPSRSPSLNPTKSPSFDPTSRPTLNTLDSLQKSQ